MSDPRDPRRPGGPRGGGARGAGAGDGSIVGEQLGGAGGSARSGPPAAAARSRGRSARPARLPRTGPRRWPRRVLIATNVTVAILLLAAGSVYGYVNWRFGQIRRISLPSIFHAAKAQPSGSPFTVLLVGSDSRTALTAPGDQSQFNDPGNPVTGQRSDTIMLVHIDPKNTTASLLSIPRDLWVQIPGKTYKQRINTTFDVGPDLLVKAVEQDLGVPVDHYMEVNFDTFRQVVNAVGGVKEYFPTPARDAYSLLNIPQAGCYTLDGNQALAFVRARHYEYRDARGVWHFEAESDLARIKRQQNFIRKMISRAQSTGLTDPLRLNGVVAGITTNLTLDSGFSKSELLSLAKRFRSINPSTLPSATVPTTSAVIQGNDVLLLKQPDAQQAIDQFLGRTPAPATPSTLGPVPANVAPATVRLSVRNGSGRTREATTVAAGLRQDGFDVVSYGDAGNHNYVTTTVLYPPGAEDKARYVASVVQGGVTLQPDATVTGADVVLVTGQTFTGLGPLPVAGTTTVPTTAAPPTTVPAAPPTTAYELPGTPAGFVAPPC